MNTKTLTTGMSLDRHHHVCVLDAAGEILAEVIANTRKVVTTQDSRKRNGRPHLAAKAAETAHTRLVRPLTNPAKSSSRTSPRKDSET